MRITLLSIFILLASVSLPFTLQAQTDQLRVRMMALTYHDIIKAYKDPGHDSQKVIKKIESFLDLYKNDVPNTKHDNDMRKEARKMLKKLQGPEEQRQAVKMNKLTELPELIGGISNLQKQMNYPDKARRNNIEGEITVQFFINKNGDVEDVITLNSLGHGLDEEAIRVAKLAKFKPAKIDGKPVRVKFTLPLLFRLK